MNTQILKIPLCVFAVLYICSTVEAGILQWRVRVPAGVENPNNIGSYVNTIETDNGGTKSYDPGLDVDLDTSLMPNTYFFVSYVDHEPEKVEYEFIEFLTAGESYSVRLSFENPTGGFFFTPVTIDFLVADGMFEYDLSIDTNDNGSPDTFRHGIISNPLGPIEEIDPWNQLIFQGNDHRNGWSFAELTITAMEESSPSANADFDDNGLVDQVDLGLWRTGYQTVCCADHSDGDSDEDQDVDGRDFLNWQLHIAEDPTEQILQFGEPIVAIPEPRTIGLLFSFLSSVILAHSRHPHP